MQHFANGLHSNCTVSKLLLNECVIPQKSTAFSEFLKSVQAQPCSLKELRYNSNLGCFVEAMVLNRPHTDGSRVGSALRALWLQSQTDSHDIAGFLHSYGTMASSIRLKKLNIVGLCRKSSEALVQCLPHLVYLRSLKISNILLEVQENARRLVKAFKQNGSLRKVSVPKMYIRFYSSSRSGFYFMGRSRLRSYCTRNRKLLTMLRTQVQNGQPTDIWLFPTLFHAARQAKRTAQNMTFVGLQSLAGIAWSHKGGQRCNVVVGKVSLQSGRSLLSGPSTE
jgi:hypothetical protein